MIRQQYTVSENLSGSSTWQQWGTDAGDAVRIHSNVGGLPLTAVFISAESEIDQVWIGQSQSSWQDFKLCGLKNPFYPEYEEQRKDLWVKPYQFFNSAIVSSKWDAPVGWAPNPPISDYVEAHRGQIYGRVGGYLSLDAFYGGMPVMPPRRDGFVRTHIMSAGNGNTAPGAAAPVFRNIIVGRDAWELSSLAIDAAFIWTIYGCTESRSNQRRDQLATGTGSFSYQGSRGYDAIELDGANGAGAGTATLRFTARDW